MQCNTPVTSVDNCPYPSTKAPEGWQARIDGKRKDTNPYSKGCRYADHIYWAEGWYRAGKALRYQRDVRRREAKKLALAL